MKKNTSRLSQGSTVVTDLGHARHQEKVDSYKLPFQGLQPSNSDLELVLTGYDCFFPNK